MQILVLNTFMYGRDRYIKDEVRSVSEEVGLSAVGNGWAEDMAGRVATNKTKQESVDLVVDKSTIGLGDTNG